MCITSLLSQHNAGGSFFLHAIAQAFMAGTHSIFFTIFASKRKKKQMEKTYLDASADGLRLATSVIKPEGRPVGVLQLAHGMCDHKERYYPFMQHMAQHGYVCVVHDHRGHGETVKTPGDLGYMYSGGWRAMVEDLHIVNQWIHRQYSTLPLFMLGHSMGSMVARSYAKRYDSTIDTLIVCGSPSRNPAVGLARLCTLLAGHSRPQLLQRLTFGTFNRPFRHEGYPQAWVCSDAATLKAYHADPLCTFTFTANGFENLFALMQDCYSPRGWTVANPTMPVYFISGALDPCRLSDKAFHAAASLMTKMGYLHVSERLYPGMRHELLAETARQQVWRDVLHALNTWQ